MSSLESTELTLWHYITGSLANAELPPGRKARKETQCSEGHILAHYTSGKVGTLLWSSPVIGKGCSLGWSILVKHCRDPRDADPFPSVDQFV